MKHLFYYLTSLTAVLAAAVVPPEPTSDKVKAPAEKLAEMATATPLAIIVCNCDSGKAEIYPASTPEVKGALLVGELAKWNLPFNVGPGTECTCERPIPQKARAGDHSTNIASRPFHVDAAACNQRHDSSKPTETETATKIWQEVQPVFMRLPPRFG